MFGTSKPRIRIYHNNLWARYKGLIFSSLYEQARSQGIDVSFVQIAETSVERLMLGGVDRTFHRYPFKLLFRGSSNDIPTYKLVPKLATDVLGHKCDLVVIAGYHRPEYWAMLLACMLLRRKRAVWVDSTRFDRDKKAWKERAKAYFFRQCDGFFVYGSRSREYVESYGIEAHKIFDRCQAAALPRSYDVAAVRRYHEAHPVSDPTAPRFLYIGRLAAEKGLSDLLAAFKEVHERLPGATLRLAGSGVLLHELTARARELGLDDCVTFLGAKDPEDLAHLLMESTAMVVSSYREPWGLVVNEALSFGCPVVVSDICGCLPELVQEGKTGFAYPAGNIEVLTKNMFAVAQLASNRLAVAQACLDTIAPFTPENAAARILAGCLTILHGSGMATEMPRSAASSH